MYQYGKDIKIAVEVLGENNHQYTEKFSCGNSSIDDYFNFKAAHDKTSVTYLFIDVKEDRLIACVTVACSAIFEETDEDLFSTILSAMEIKYLATDERYQHIPYSAENDKVSLSDVIFDYIIHSLKDASHNVIGAAKIVLYAVKKAVSFYKRHDFKDFGNTMYGDQGYYVSGCKPMYFDLNY